MCRCAAFFWSRTSWMSDWHRESCGPSDGVMVRLLSVIEGVRGGGVEVWPDKMNRSIKSGQDLNICISTESEPDEEKRPPWRGKLFDVWMSECVRPFAETHSWLHSFGQSLGLSHRSCWKTLFFLVTFSLHVGCLAVGPSCSRAWTGSGGRMARWSRTLLPLDLLLYRVSSRRSREDKQIF